MENRGDKRKSPVLYLVLPCYNEEAVLPVTIPMFLEKLEEMLFHGKIDQESKVLLVDDGSRDRTWELICQMAEKDCRCIGIRQSRNRGHQNAILAGMMEARKLADAVITADCDGQDDMAAMEEMVDAYLDGCDIVYGVRRSRELDTGFKRMTAEGFYRLMKLLGAETVYNHADYRLVSRQVLEELEHARKRGATIVAEVVGYGATCDAYHMTAPRPDGSGAAKAMEMALADGGAKPEDVDYINAHGTSTPLNDAGETAAVKTVFGDHAYKLAISSTKSMTGHMLGAAGGAEAVASVLALRDGIAPPTINLTQPDPDCDLDYTPLTAKHADFDVALSSSLGFGGHNACLAFRKWEG